MGQVNVNYDDRTLAGIDRICSVKGLSRTEVMRLIATEAIEAHDAGRLAFQEVGGPKLGGTLNALAAQLRDNMVEQDRLLRSTQRHEKKMLDEKAAGAFGGWSDLNLMRNTYTHAEDAQGKVNQAMLRGLHTAETNTGLKLRKEP
ncbi:hypothetical protein ACFFF7_03870 [Novosphingobium aquiterrae]|uniref:Ribbon-helix-helix protein CopG domain-containing protein n=1 Tax=Novosphingobium aquiterrae TaxID=624388 RepID=A0ABV6PFE2_9SPHN